MNESNPPIISGSLDESSSLSQPEQYFIVALVTVKNPFSPVWPQIFKRTRRRLGKRQRQIGEFKFYKSDEQIKRSILQQLARRDEIDIFVTVVDKADRRVPDTPEHYGMVVGQTVVNFLSRFGQLGLPLLPFDLPLEGIDLFLITAAYQQYETGKESDGDGVVHHLTSNRFVFPPKNCTGQHCS